MPDSILQSLKVLSMHVTIKILEEQPTCNSGVARLFCLLDDGLCAIDHLLPLLIKLALLVLLLEKLWLK